VVDDRVLVELKSVDPIAGAHARQLLTWLKLTKMRVGLLIAVLRHCGRGCVES
jgi:GxxExxY protein